VKFVLPDDRHLGETGVGQELLPVRNAGARAELTAVGVVPGRLVEPVDRGSQGTCQPGLEK
jgi:hypothetical protein